MDKLHFKTRDKNYEEMAVCYPDILTPDPHDTRGALGALMITHTSDEESNLSITDDLYSLNGDMSGHEVQLLCEKTNDMAIRDNASNEEDHLNLVLS